MMEVAAFAIAFFFAMNIGASGTAAAMGPAYGSGAIKKKRVAMLLVGACAWLGALAGGEVVRTIGEGIVPPTIMQMEVVVIVLGAACLTLFFANLIGIPLSTSEVVVGSLVGAGLAYQALYWQQLLIIMSFWIVIPFAAFFLALGAGRTIKKHQAHLPFLRGDGKWHKPLTFILIACGCLEAFSAGMNNVANAVGPLVGVGALDVTTAAIAGGFFVALGALLLGGKVLETNGKHITNLSLLQGSTVSFTGGGLVIIASIFGLPVPLTQITTAAIVGIGTAENGFVLWQKSVIRRILKVWIVSPLFALAVSYSLILLFRSQDYYTLVVIVSVFIATVGAISLYRSVRQDKEQTMRDGEGI
ncbi:sulfate permease CysP [Shouchella clausii]|uniref:inorganic phosphate transporter n=1 Tax=Shouchella tritolerans TaxID=2979466 RepID=UPI001B119450|nr:inorganic phosphate transporter [Shouchella tritolerans]GIN13658.1 sulfate permease CysP [Shouchella clausii]